MDFHSFLFWGLEYEPENYGGNEQEDGDDAGEHGVDAVHFVEAGAAGGGEHAPAGEGGEGSGEGEGDEMRRIMWTPFLVNPKSRHLWSRC